MATVDELKILIKAETKQLKKELDGVNKKLNKTNEVSKKTNKNLAGAFAKAGVAATALIAVEAWVVLVSWAVKVTPGKKGGGFFLAMAIAMTPLCLAAYCSRCL